MREETRDKILSAATICGLCGEVHLKTGLRAHLLLKHKKEAPIIEDMFFKAIEEYGGLRLKGEYSKFK